MAPYERKYLPRLVPLPGEPGGGRRPRARSVATACAILVAIAVTWGIGGSACGPADEPLPPRTERPDGDLADAGNGPCVEGSKRACTVVIGQQGDVTTCLEGVRTCRDGVWSECEGTMTQKNLVAPPEDEDADEDDDVPDGSSPAAIKQKSALSMALGDPTACESNPCDPSCHCFDEAPTGGVPLAPHISGYYQEGSLEDAIAHSPQGFIDKGLKKPCTTTMDCQFDFHCVDSVCKSWGPGETIPHCNLPNLTTGFACTKDGKPTVPVCNRGNATAPAGIMLFIFPGNSPQFPTCVPDNQPYKCQTQEPIGPGSCINVLNCPGLTGKGNKTIMVNPPLKPPSGEPNPKWVSECTCEDNWGDWSGSDTYCIEKPNYDTEPLTYTQRYVGECPEGSHVQWTYMTYRTVTPSDSNIHIFARSAELLTELDTAPLVDIAWAKRIPTPDTQICTLTGPAPCPIDLYEKLGGPRSATNEHLELVFTLNPSTSKAEGPTLESWEVFYSCPWTE